MRENYGLDCGKGCQGMSFSFGSWGLNYGERFANYESSECQLRFRLDDLSLFGASDIGSRQVFALQGKALLRYAVIEWTLGFRLQGGGASDIL